MKPLRYVFDCTCAPSTMSAITTLLLSEGVVNSINRIDEVEKDETKRKFHGRKNTSRQSDEETAHTIAVNLAKNNGGKISVVKFAEILRAKGYSTKTAPTAASKLKLIGIMKNENGLLTLIQPKITDEEIKSKVRAHDKILRDKRK